MLYRLFEIISDVFTFLHPVLLCCINLVECAALQHVPKLSDAFCEKQEINLLFILRLLLSSYPRPF